MNDPTNNPAPAPTFIDRAYARPALDGEDPAVSMARRILAECEASRPDEWEVWERYGALQAAVSGLLNYVRAHAAGGQK